AHLDVAGCRVHDDGGDPHVGHTGKELVAAVHALHPTDGSGDCCLWSISYQYANGENEDRYRAHDPRCRVLIHIPNALCISCDLVVWWSGHRAEVQESSEKSSRENRYLVV